PTDRAGRGKPTAHGARAFPRTSNRDLSTVARSAKADARRRQASGGDVTRLFIGAGREAGIRPGDLVGAITGEAGIDSRDLGAIEIADRFSLVDVPKSRAEDIMAALRASTLRGKKVTVRLDRGASRS